MTRPGHPAGPAARENFFPGNTEVSCDRLDNGLNVYVTAYAYVRNHQRFDDLGSEPAAGLASSSPQSRNEPFNLPAAARHAQREVLTGVAFHLKVGLLELGPENATAQFCIERPEVGEQATLKAAAQSGLQFLEFQWPAVRCERYRLSSAVQKVEGVVELLLRTLLARYELHVINE